MSTDEEITNCNGEENVSCLEQEKFADQQKENVPEKEKKIDEEPAQEPGGVEPYREEKLEEEKVNDEIENNEHKDDVVNSNEQGMNEEVKENPPDQLPLASEETGLGEEAFFPSKSAENSFPSTSDENCTTAEATPDSQKPIQNVKKEIAQYIQPPIKDNPPEYESKKDTSNTPANEFKLVPKPMEENFWLDGNYKKVIRRIEDGSKNLEDLSKMIRERAEIESLYANKLKSWQHKWTDVCNKSYEYATAQTALLNGFQEASSLVDLHASVSNRLEELSRGIQQWRSDNYPKVMTMKLKESKRCEDAFVKAQKPWVLKYNEANKCMKAYHSANHLLGIGNNQVIEAKQSSSTTPEQLSKLHSRVNKLEQEIVTTKEKYEEALRDISSYNLKYQQDMKYEFDRCQTFEEKRRNYFKEKLLHYHICIDRSMFAESYKTIYSELVSQYASINVLADLKWYEESYGTDHPFVTLSYVEYDPNLHGQLETSDRNTFGQADKTKQSPAMKEKKSGVCTTL